MTAISGEVLILGRTRMGQSHHCVGGFDLTQRTAVRLLTRRGEQQPPTTQLAVDEVWEVTYVQAPKMEAPHTEDVWVQSATRVEGATATVADVLPDMHCWSGDPDDLFDGRLGWTWNGSGYISQTTGVPDYSVGFWHPARALVKEKDSSKYLYDGSGSHLPYVGVAPLAQRIEARTLVRVSLARWWRPDNSDVELRCYLQLSGSFGRA